MPNKIDTDSIVRDRQDKLQDSADQSNADYVTQLEKTSSLMPPEKPFETEAAQQKGVPDVKKDAARSDDFVQKIKSSSNDIERFDQSNEVKLHLLTGEYQKIANKLGFDTLSKKDEASLQTLLDDVQDKIDLYKSKLKAGIMSTPSELELEAMDEDGEGDGEGDVIADGLKEQVLMAAPGIIAGKKEDEEEEELEEGEKEIDQ